MSMQETNTMTRDNLFAAVQIMPVVPDKMTVAQSGAMKRGTLLDASGAIVTSTTSGDTTTYADVYAVLAEDVDTTSAAAVAAVYLTGEFSEDALIIDTDEDIDDYKASARKVGIFVKKNIA